MDSKGNVQEFSLPPAPAMPAAEPPGAGKSADNGNTPDGRNVTLVQGVAPKIGGGIANVGTKSLAEGYNVSTGTTGLIKEKGELIDSFKGKYSHFQEYKTVDDGLVVLKAIKAGLSKDKVQGKSCYEAMSAKISALKIPKEMTIKLSFAPDNKKISLIPLGDEMKGRDDIMDLLQRSIDLLDGHVEGNFKGFDLKKAKAEIEEVRQRLVHVSSELGDSEGVNNLIKAFVDENKSRVIVVRSVAVEGGKKNKNNFVVEMTAKEEKETDDESHDYTQKGKRTGGADVQAEVSVEEQREDSAEGANTNEGGNGSATFTGVAGATGGAGLIGAEKHKEEDEKFAKSGPGVLEPFFVGFRNNRPVNEQAVQILDKVADLIKSDDNLPGVAIIYSASHDQTKKIIGTYNQGGWFTNTNGSNQATVIKEIEELLKTEKYSSLQYKFRIAPISTLNRDKSSSHVVEADVDVGINYMKSGLIGKGWHVLGWQNEDSMRDNIPYAIGGGIAGFSNVALRVYTQTRLKNLTKKSGDLPGNF